MGRVNCEICESGQFFTNSNSMEYSSCWYSIPVYQLPLMHVQVTAARLSCRVQNPLAILPSKFWMTTKLNFCCDRWIPRTKGQQRGKCFHFMTSSWFSAFALSAVNGGYCQRKQNWCKDYFIVANAGLALHKSKRIYTVHEYTFFDLCT